jgi:hypothetical protein
MPTKDEDTDPSTPIARRSPETMRVSGSPSDRPISDTNPGVGEPVTLASRPPAKPLGIVVPSPSQPPSPSRSLTPSQPQAPPMPPTAAGSPTPSRPPTRPVDSPAMPGHRKDSVELLLDGMGEPHLDRPKTTPQSDGQSSASYHAQHSVHASDPPVPADSPKVLLERPDAETDESREFSSTSSVRQPTGQSRFNTTEVALATPVPLTRRLLAAAGLGTLVAVLAFAVLQRTTHHATAETAAGPKEAETAASAPLGSAIPVAPAPSADVPTAPSAPPPIEGAANSAPSSSAAAAHTHAAKKRPKPAPSGDLGELRPSF